MKRFQKTILFLLNVILILSCHRNDFDPNKITLEEAKSELPLYYNFIEYLVNDGYEFWDFNKFWYADKESLPEKLMVLRHDVHYRDIYFAYHMYVIEKELIGEHSATYYVMLNNPAGEANNDAEVVSDEYIDLILFLKDENVDVQPHISPCDMYLDMFNPFYENMETDDMMLIFNKNYKVDEFDDGIDIIVLGSDTLDLDHINLHLPNLLENYNHDWNKKTDLKVKSYAVHGSTSTLNYVLKNVRLLNQRIILESNIYQFETSNTTITNYLDIIHDNWRPEWIEFPYIIEPGKYELLIHPYVWDDPQKWRNENSKTP